MTGSLGELQDFSKAQARSRSHSLRARAHWELRYWAQHRACTLEGLGWSSVSVFERIRLEHDGAGARSTAPGELMLVERQSERHARVLRVEILVRDMPREWAAVIETVYLLDKTQSFAAIVLGIERWRLVGRLQDAQERMAAVIERWPQLRHNEDASV